MRERERERECVCVCVCVCEREREGQMITTIRARPTTLAFMMYFF